MRNRTKKILIGVLTVLVIACMASLFLLIRHSEDATDSQPIDSADEIGELEEGNGITYDEEWEEAEISKVPAEKEAFLGKWTAKSDQAHYLYGNIDITINEDGTWDANVTEEVFKGTWTKDKYGITLTSELLDCKFYFSESGNLIMEDYRFEDNDDPIITVLTKK